MFLKKPLVVGVEIALYFAWLGFLNYFLVGAALAGIFVFFNGIHLLGTDFPEIVSRILPSTFLAPSGAQEMLMFVRLSV